MWYQPIIVLCFVYTKIRWTQNLALSVDFNAIYWYHSLSVCFLDHPELRQVLRMRVSIHFTVYFRPRTTHYEHFRHCNRRRHGCPVLWRRTAGPAAPVRSTPGSNWASRWRRRWSNILRGFLRHFSQRRRRWRRLNVSCLLHIVNCEHKTIRRHIVRILIYRT